ncbi:MAG: class I SAM-dependent methyltransferase [Candidatus Paceibacterota bacterium]
MKRFLTKKMTSGRNDFVRKYQTKAYTLDIGCEGKRFLDAFPNRVGLDVIPGEGVDVVADAHQLPFEKNTFDVVLCSEVLEHLHSPKQAISEMYRVLKPGGILILTTRFMFPIHDAPADYFRFSKGSLYYLLTDWNVIDFQKEANALGTIGILLQRIVYQTDLRGGKVTRVLLLLCAHLVSKLSFLVLEEYSDVKRLKKEPMGVFTTGYYLAAKKPIK